MDAYALGDLVSVIDEMQDGLAITNRDGEFVYINRAHLEFFEYTKAEQLIGKTWKTLYREKEALWFESYVMPRLFANGSWRGEAVGRSATGRRVHQEVALTVGSAGAIICQTRDIGIRKADEDQAHRIQTILRRLERTTAIEQIFAGAVHDLSSFLTLAEMRLALVLDAGTLSKSLSSHVRIAAEAMRQAKAIAAETRARSVLAEAGRFDLVELVRTTVDIARQGDADRMDVSFVPELLAAYVELDPVSLMRALINLIRNAREASGDKPIAVTIGLKAEGGVKDATMPSLRLGASLSGPSVCIAVRDWGRGIEPSALPQIFNAYFTTKTGQSGADRGIGLNSVLELLKATGGEVVVCSKLGEGTQVSLMLPASEIVRRPSRLGERPPKKSSAAVIEDNEEWRDAIAEILRSHNLAVETYRNPDVFLDSLAKESLCPAIVILDEYFEMGQLTGSQVVKTIKSACADAIVIGFSNHPKLDEKGFDQQIHKSNGIDALHAAIKDVLQEVV